MQVVHRCPRLRKTSCRHPLSALQSDSENDAGLQNTSQQRLSHQQQRLSNRPQLLSHHQQQQRLSRPHLLSNRTLLLNNVFVGGFRD